MVTLNQINDFLGPKKMAVAGVSRDDKKFGNLVYKSLLEKGYDVCPINPMTEKIDEEKCYPSVLELPDGYNRLYIVTPKNKTIEVLEQAAKKGIKFIWIQSKSETKEALAFAREKGIDTIYKKCMFMFTEPVEGGHKFHRTIVKFFGGYPKLKKS